MADLVPAVRRQDPGDLHLLRIAMLDEQVSGVLDNRFCLGGNPANRIEAIFPGRKRQARHSRKQKK